MQPPFKDAGGVILCSTPYPNVYEHTDYH